MSTLTYTLIPGGYEILQDGRPWIHQPFDPSQPGMLPYPTPEAAEEAAKAKIAELAAVVAPATRPTLVLTSTLAIDSSHAAASKVELDKHEITMPQGASLVDDPTNGIGKLVDAQGHVIPVDATFRLPLQPTDALGAFQGQADYVDAELKKGILHSSWTPEFSGRYVITEATINAGLPEAAKMAFAGLTIYVKRPRT